MLQSRFSRIPCLSLLRPGLVLLTLLTGSLTGGIAFGANAANVDITIKDHLFVPSQVFLPANQPVVLHVRNEDATAEEFESVPLKIEKIITGGAEIVVRLRPLPPGQYRFFGEFNADTAQGVFVVE